VGRNVDEVLRLVQAFQYVDEHGEVLHIPPPPTRSVCSWRAGLTSCNIMSRCAP
jgi:alkyl hydroperoxide reductase subunit AhpC